MVYVSGTMTPKNSYQVRRQCKECEQIVTFPVFRTDWHSWVNVPQSERMPVQTAFPYLSADERELLVSGICGTCFDDMCNELKEAFGGTDENAL